jgi:hypothetical protein
MALYFRNSTNRTLWIVYAYYSPGCPGVTWAKKGWYKNLPENTVNVRSGFAGGQTFFYFAHDDAGREWSGEFSTQVPSNAFEWCWEVGSTTARTVGFRQVGPIDSSFTDYTVTLTP